MELRSTVWIVFSIFLISLQMSLIRGDGKLKTAAKWSELEYEFPSAAEKQDAIIQGRYVAGAGVPYDVDVDYRSGGHSKVFVTVPRTRPGIPITLGILTANRGRGGPVLAPYPDYYWQNSHGSNCEGITSVYRIAIDECRRLWVLDEGKVNGKPVCPPQLLAFDLKTDSLVHRYRFPEEVIRSGMSTLITPVVDVRDSCEHTRVYIADVDGFGIIVYDMKTQTSWRTTSKLMYPYPDHASFKVAGESFDLLNGILGMALSPKETCKSSKCITAHSNRFSFPDNSVVPESNRILYFHALAAITENSVPLRILDNRTMWEENPDASPRSFKEIGSRGVQSVAQAMDKNGNLYFGLLDPIGIACWDSRTSYNKRNIKIVARDDEALQFTSGMKIVTNAKGEEELWVLSNRLQKTMTGSMTNRETNFRIMAIRIRDLLGPRERCEFTLRSNTVELILV